MKNNTVPSAPAAVSSYEQSALDFLAKHGITFRASGGDTARAPFAKAGEPCGYHYTITLTKEKTLSDLSFDFWGSVNDAKTAKRPTPYSVLACISGDIHCPSTFADFCAEYGYDEDSRAAHATFTRCAAFAKRLRGFFTKKQIEGLSEIQ